MKTREKNKQAINKDDQLHNNQETPNIKNYT